MKIIYTRNNNGGISISNCNDDDDYDNHINMIMFKYDGEILTQSCR